MSRRALRHCVTALLGMLLGAAGCAHERLPRYAWHDVPTALRDLEARSGQVRTISAEGQVTLNDRDGRSVRVDAALAAEPPERVRLRAWKFGQAALDVTLTPQGLWIMQPRRQSAAPATAPAAIDADQFRRMWRLIDGGLFADPAGTAEVHGDALLVRQQQPEGLTVVCQVDRRTLTPRRYEVFDESGALRFTLRLDRFALFDQIVWPRRIVATSEQGDIRIDLREITFNQPLPPEAFVHPRRAQKADGSAAPTQPVAP